MPFRSQEELDAVVAERFHARRVATLQPTVRADLTYFAVAGGGAVFAASSIAWSGALSFDAYDNNVSRITANVLNRFIGRTA